MMTVKDLFYDFSSLFFPHTCSGCSTDLLNEGSPLCLRCIVQLPVTNFHSYAGNVVEKHFWGRLNIHSASSHCYFTQSSLIQHLLHQLKYKANKDVGHFLGQLMGKTLHSSDRFTGVHALVPLPLYAARERKRGYNQATVLCDGMALSMKIPVLKNAVVRLSSTATQTHKNRVERWQNMQGRFHVHDPSAIEGKHILLTDDVITTGATLEACGQELLKHCSKLSIVTLACTV
jgi:ComF family protein